MTISLWRLSHLWLAIISGIFLLVASITGLILAFEPVYENSHDFKISNADNLSVAELIGNLSDVYPEISNITRDHNGFVMVTALGEEGEQSFYVNPFNGEKLGNSLEKSDVFNFCRTLHRSLFFGKFGRFLVGMAAMFLLFISVSGFVLVLKKQGGLKTYFRKVIKDEFYRDYHTKLGKLFLVVIFVISLTGVYLFLERFSVIPKSSSEHEIDFENLSEEPVMQRVDFPLFQKNKVGKLEELIFPFSEFADDFFELKLKGQELLINQITGDVVSTISYPTTKKLSNLAFSLHTAEGQPWWAMLLGITSMSLLFFMFSGFKIYLQRAAEKPKVTNPHEKEVCSVVIAVGSEMGSTLIFAQALHDALLDARQKSYLVEMNAFEHFPAMKYLIIVTSTYGTGGPPSNALNYLKKFDEIKNRLSPFYYAVIGFGSTRYPDFCQYAIDVNNALKSHLPDHELIPLKTIDNRSASEFYKWVDMFQAKMDIRLSVKQTETEKDLVNLRVVKKEKSKNASDATFLLELASKNGKLSNYQSGDLLIYRPKQDGIERHYSMSVNMDKQKILLSIKKHSKGLASQYLFSLKKNDLIEASLCKNPSFHFPENANHVIMIANGTGIAPFIGMIAGNKRKIPVSLYWGGQNEDSFDLYRNELDSLCKKGYLNRVRTAFSRIKKNPVYVQDLIETDESFIVQCLSEESIIMICGSLKMQELVEEILNEMSNKHFNKHLDYFKELGCIKADCY